jgi:predicted transcriptional regulator
MGLHKHQLHRSNYEIVNDILQTVASKYDCMSLQISYSAGLTYCQVKQYVGLLIDRGLILISSKSEDFKRYEISDLGRCYLQVFAEIEDDLRPVLTAEIVMDGIRPH